MLADQTGTDMDPLTIALDLASELERSGIRSVFGYGWWVLPATKLAHALGAALLFGCLVPMNLRMLGVWRAAPLHDLARVLVRSSLVGGLVAIVSGVLLLSLNARGYVQNEMMWWKAGFFVAALLNALALRFVPAWRYLARVDSRGTIRRFRWAGLIGLVAWGGVMVCGQLINF